MVNPLLKHRILKYLPYDDLRNPTVEGIQLFIAKRRKRYFVLIILSLAIAVIYPLGVELIRGNTNSDEIIFSILNVIMALLCFREYRKSTISETEITDAIREFNLTK